MSRITGLFDANLGIQSVMESPLGESGMPQARPLASNLLREAGLEELYNPTTAQGLVHNALCPDVGDGEILRPDIFSANIKKCFASLSMSKDPAVRDFIRSDLTPLIENTQLLQAYTGLMVGG